MAKEPLSEEISVLIDNLTNIKNAIDESNPELLKELLKKSRLIKESLDE